MIGIVRGHIGVGNDGAAWIPQLFFYDLADAREQAGSNQHIVAARTAADFDGNHGYGMYGFQRKEFGSVAEVPSVIKVVQSMLSLCRSAKSALMRLRLL